MTIKDYHGNALTGADPDTVAMFQQALADLQCYINDPVATIRTAIEARPDFVMGHVMHAWLHLLGTEASGLPVAAANLEAARTLPANSRERAHLAAIEHLVSGRWHAAGRVLEDISIDHPLDALALQVGHQVDFFTGESRMLRDRIARALPAWSAGVPGYHAVLGMHAFGLEETGAYERAEAAGRRAVELEQRDGWGQHAVAHVLEMQGRQREGIAWMRANPEAWSKDSFFAVHNWWHLALYHLDLDDIDEVLVLFDGPIHGSRSQMAMDMLDASAMLWRLHLRGLDVGQRWHTVADGWATLAADGIYAFNDAHAMMAFVGAGREDLARTVLEVQERVMQGAGDNAMFTREVGSPLTRAIHAFGHGDFATAVRLLRPVRNHAARFGGSHAQRDLIDLTLIEAALRDRQVSLARALVAERTDLKPASPANHALQRRVASAASMARAA